MQNRSRSQVMPGLRRAAWRLALPALAAALLGLVAALPSAANASEPAPGGTVHMVLGAEAELSSLTPAQVQELLAGVPVGEGGIPAGELDPEQLAKELAELPGIEELEGLSGLGGASGLEAALREALESLAAENPNLGELLSPEGLAGPLLERLEATLGLPVRTSIEELLGGEPQQALEEALETGLGSTSLSELLAKLLGSAENPTQLIDRLLEALNPATLEEQLGALPTGEPPQNLNVEELAGALGQTPEQLAEALGQAANAVPATAAVVTRTLEGGNELAAINGLEGLGLALISKAGEGIGGSGGPGGGSTGASGSPGTTVLGPGPTPAAAAAGSPSSPHAASVGKVKILSSKTKGKRATIVVQVPSAGKLTLSGGGVKRVSREAAEAERMTLTTTLTKARSASLRKHHRKSTKVGLTAAFAPVSGAASKATKRITLH